MNGFAEGARLAAVAWVIGNHTCLALIWDAAIVGWKRLNARYQANTTGLLLLAQEETQMKQTFKACCVAVSPPPPTAPQLRWARPGSGRDQAFSATSSSYRSGLAGFLTATNITLKSENATQIPLQQPVVLFGVFLFFFFLRERNEDDFTTGLNQFSLPVGCRCFFSAPALSTAEMCKNVPLPPFDFHRRWSLNVAQQFYYML